jgi:hypothetical protein
MTALGQILAPLGFSGRHPSRAKPFTVTRPTQAREWTRNDQRNGDLLAQLLAQTRVLGLHRESLRKSDAPDFQSGRRLPDGPLGGPKIQTLLSSSIHGSRLQIETGDKILVLDEPTRLKLIEKRRQALIGRVEA